MKKISVQSLVRCAMIASIYTAISIAMLPLAFGVVQARVSEALTLLPVLTPLAIPGVTIGCMITNIYGVATGANILGAIDIVLGTSATLMAALITRWLRRFTFRGLPVLASLPPVILNAIVVGGELTWAEMNTLHTPLLWVNMFQVGLGQFIACTVLGLLLVWTLQKGGLDKILFASNRSLDK